MRSGGALRALCQLGVALWIGVALSLVETSPTAEPLPEVETRAAPLQPQPSRSEPLPPKPAEPTRVGGHEIDTGLTLLAAGLPFTLGGVGTRRVPISRPQLLVDTRDAYRVKPASSEELNLSILGERRQLIHGEVTETEVTKQTAP